ncbi:MAG: FKBP-type peptidyl-prolyl cis-trans isomerase [Bacteroidales bacterium]|nr:FKBP-type peptidyl-prolyl cis-trans isomerase [Bacteroidales bacterium]
MRRIMIFCTILAAMALLATGCAKTLDSKTNEEAQRYYNSWITVKKDAHPEFCWWPICYGTPATGGTADKDYGYILTDYPGDGEEISDSIYLFINYVTYDLYGTVQNTTDKEVAHRTGVSYDLSYYYGPVVIINTEYNSNVGFYDALNGWRDGEQVYDKVKVGGKRSFVLPGWLTGAYRFGEKMENYLYNVTGTDIIYDVEVTDMTDDINQFQIDSIEAYCGRKYKFRDSTYTGFYYKSLNKPKTSISFEDDTTIYINYIGRLLNGQVFDTNIADTAKMWNLYSASNTYGPVQVNWSSDSTEVTMGEDGNDVITGFASILTRMTDKETSVGIFYSDLGYGSSGSGYTIPSYAPLEFEISIVDSE